MTQPKQDDSLRHPAYDGPMGIFEGMYEDESTPANRNVLDMSHPELVGYAGRLKEQRERLVEVVGRLMAALADEMTCHHVNGTANRHDTPDQAYNARIYRHAEVVHTEAGGKPVFLTEAARTALMEADA